MTYLLLNKRELFQIAFEERHLLLLGLGVAVADYIVVLLLDFVELNFELNDLSRVGRVSLGSAPLRKK